jgi:hypothetical protein
MSNRIAPIVLIAMALTGCATSLPYAEVSGEKVTRADPREEEVFVTAIDGKLDLRGSKTATIEPGQRLLVLDTARQGRSRNRTGAYVPLNAKPCLRYYFVARHESMTQVEPWSLVLTNVEPIPECVAKFPELAPVPAPAPAASKPAA